MKPGVSTQSTAGKFCRTVPGNYSSTPAITGSAHFFLIIVMIFGAGVLQAAADQVSGTVTSLLGPVEGARVRVQTDVDPNFVVTGANGMFVLETPSGDVTITAGRYMCINSSVETTGGSSGVDIGLTWMNWVDHMDYAYIDPRDGSPDAYRCSACHTVSYPQWLNSVMATSQSNNFVYSYYNGTTADGSQTAGFGYRLEHPDDNGDCADCHLPAMASKSVDPDSDFKDLNNGRDDFMSGILCDWCHKVVVVEPNTLPARVREKYFMRRVISIPDLGAGPMMGPLDDSDYQWMAPSYSPVMNNSTLCAACHLDSNENGIPSEETYTEWLNSSYPAAGEGCAECHMESTGTENYVAEGGEFRDPSQFHSHSFEGKTEAFLTDAVTLLLDATRGAGDVTVDVTIDNTETGHSVPTGFHTRNMILLVSATDSAGQPLTQSAGPEIPDWGGVGDPADGNYAGLPGQGYAKILGDGSGNERVFYTEATQLISDNRIPADGMDATQYIFDDPGPGAGDITVQATLIYRRSWKDVMDEKEWGIPDVTMEEDSLVLPSEMPVSVSASVSGSDNIPRGGTLRVLVGLTNNVAVPVTAVTRGEIHLPGAGGTITKGPVNVDLDPLEQFLHIYRLEIPGYSPLGSYSMDVIADVAGSESDRASITFQVVPGED